MVRLITALVVFSSIITTSAQVPSSGCDLITNDGKCFSYFSGSRNNWFEARRRCRSWGGDLASIESSREDRALKMLRSRTDGCFIGLNDRAREGRYVWSDGSNSRYRNWNRGEPNNRGNEDCGETDFGGQRNWNDESCRTERRCFYCSSKTSLENNTLIHEDTTLYCITENRRTPHVIWTYVDVLGNTLVLNSRTDVTTGVSSLTVTTDSLGYYSCQVTRDNGVSTTYRVGLVKLSSITDNRGLSLIPDIRTRQITLDGGNTTAECVDPHQRGFNIFWRNVTVLPLNHGVMFLGQTIVIQNNGLPEGNYSFECIGENVRLRQTLQLNIMFLPPKGSLMTINEIAMKENATLNEINQGIELALTYSNSLNSSDRDSIDILESLVNDSLVLSENLEQFASEVLDTVINNLVVTTSNLLKSSDTHESPNSVELQEMIARLITVVEIVGAISMNGLNENETERIFTSERVLIVSQVISRENRTDTLLTIPKSERLKIPESVSIPGTVVGDLSSDGEFRYSVAIIEVPSNFLSSKTDSSLGSRLLSLIVSSETKSRIYLTSPIQLTIFTPNIGNGLASCVFLDNGNSVFNDSGLSLSSSEGNLTVCESNHLTSFGVLIRAKDQNVDRKEALALSIISYILLTCSLIALILSILIPIVIGKEFFKVEMNRIYFNYSLALALAITAFIFGIQLPRSSEIACSVFVFLMHYFWLAVFTWGLCISVEIVYLLWITSLHRKPLFWYLLPFGWGLPLPIVIITIITTHLHYGTYKHPTNEFCFLSYENGIIWSFITPILIMLILNMTALIMAIVKIVQVSKRTGKNIGTSTLTIARQSLINSSILFPVLGLPWIILPFSLVTNSIISTTVFEWVFIILTAPSGVLFFILFTLKNDIIKEKLFKQHLFHLSKTNSSQVVNSPLTFNASRSKNENDRKSNEVNNEEKKIGLAQDSATTCTENHYEVISENLSKNSTFCFKNPIFKDPQTSPI